MCAQQFWSMPGAKASSVGVYCNMILNTNRKMHQTKKKSTQGGEQSCPMKFTYVEVHICPFLRRQGQHPTLNPETLNELHRIQQKKMCTAKCSPICIRGRSGKVSIYTSASGKEPQFSALIIRGTDHCSPLSHNHGEIARAQMLVLLVSRAKLSHCKLFLTCMRHRSNDQVLKPCLTCMRHHSNDQVLKP